MYPLSNKICSTNVDITVLVSLYLNCVVATLTPDTSCLRVEPLASVFSKRPCPFIHPEFPWRTLE